ncbi:hypothetical protein BH11BAC2_BH11BAC2_11820 [soil metagenome]
MKDNQMSNLTRLQTEQKRLKTELKSSEERLNQKFEYLENNFGSMILNSALPFSKTQRESVSGSLGKVNSFIMGILPGKDQEVKEERYSSVMKSLQMVVAGIVYRYLKKLF